MTAYLQTRSYGGGFEKVNDAPAQSTFGQCETDKGARGFRQSGLCGPQVLFSHSDLIGEQVEARLSIDAVKIWYAHRKLGTTARPAWPGRHRIEYRPSIDWLVRKRGAFENLRLKIKPVQIHSRQLNRSDRLLHLTIDTVSDEAVLCGCEANGLQARAARVCVPFPSPSSSPKWNRALIDAAAK